MRLFPKYGLSYPALDLQLISASPFSLGRLGIRIRTWFGELELKDNMKSSHFDAAMTSADTHWHLLFAFVKKLG